MDKAKRDKLLELRTKKNKAKKKEADKKHEELLQAVESLHDLFSEQDEANKERTEALLSELKKFDSFKDQVAAVENAVKNIPKTNDVAINNLQELIDSQSDFDVSGVIEAVETLSEKVEEQTVDTVSIKNTEPEEFIPVRRVVKMSGRLVYDDKPNIPSFSGGGTVVNNYNKETAKDVRFDPDETAPLFIGTHNENSNVSTTSPSWFISKFTRVSGKATRIQRKQGSWDDRATGWS